MNTEFVIDYQEAGIKLYYMTSPLQGCRNLQVEKYDRTSKYRMYITYHDGKLPTFGVEGVDTSGYLASISCHKNHYIHLVKDGKEAEP